MNIVNAFKYIFTSFLIACVLCIAVPVQKAYAFSNPAAVPLLTVANFATLAKTLISSPTGPTTLNNGDLGIDSPGTCTEFTSPCTGSINGTINNGAIQYQNAVALQGQTDATAAVTNIGLRTADQTLGAQLGGLVLGQGVYDVPAAATNLTGDLTLNGDADSVFILHLTSTFITDSGSRVLLTGGAQACHVFWKVDSSATFNGTTTMVGTVLAQASVTFPGGGATLDGRAIAQTAAVTFNNTTVNNSSCATVSSSSSSSSVSSGSTSSGPSVLGPCVAPEITTIPMIIESRRVSPTSIFISWGPFAGLDTFNVRYGPSNGNWLYNTDVSGFSTTINSLPANQPIWVQVAARNNCAIGSYGDARLVGGTNAVNTLIPRLPNTGVGPQKQSLLLPVLVGVSSIVCFVAVVRKRKKFPSN